MLGGVGSLLSVGCPICNKVVVALGVDGALAVFAPVQPYLGLLSLLLLAEASRQRVRLAASCPIRPAAQADLPDHRADVDTSR